jgi:hypothetical protein
MPDARVTLQGLEASAKQAIFSTRFLPVQTERLQNRLIVHRKQNRFICRRRIGMLVPGPQRDDEGVAFLPVERLAVDHRRAAAAEGVVDARAGVSVSFGAPARYKE